MTLEGGCICGEVRYRIDEESPPAYACFCTDCQTRTGSAFALLMPVWRRRFSIEGDCNSAERPMANDRTATVHACAECLTVVHTHHDMLPDLTFVRAGTLDSSTNLAPAAYMWTRSKPDWIALPVGARCYDTQPDHPAEWMDIFEMGRRPK